MLCIADKHCSQLCIAMLETLLCGLCVHAFVHMLCFLSHTACVEALLCLNPCSKVNRQQNALHSRQALLSAVHCDAGDPAVWPV